MGDLDTDGNGELYVVLNEPSGSDAMKIYEWDGTHNGTPTEPSNTWGPPSDSFSQMDMEYASVILNLDEGAEDANDEIVLTYRGRGHLYLAIIELSNADCTTDVEVAETGQAPSEYALKQNHPNPFNPETTIEYSLKAAGGVTINIYSIPGQRVSALVNEHQAVGVY